MFTRVDPKQAGPAALGILVPQGAKTLVIVRPRALACDLLPARWDGDTTHAPSLCIFTREEAAGTARKLFAALESAVAFGVNPVQTIGDRHGERFQIWLHTQDFVWVAYKRTPGQAYQPMLFATGDEALREAEKLGAIVWPHREARQEYYFNTQSFS